jgi:hypothetical protein
MNWNLRDLNEKKLIFFVKSLRNLAQENGITKLSVWTEVLKVTLCKVAVIHELETYSGAKSELY